METDINKIGVRAIYGGDFIMVSSSHIEDFVNNMVELKNFRPEPMYIKLHGIYMGMNLYCFDELPGCHFRKV